LVLKRGVGLGRVGRLSLIGEIVLEWGGEVVLGVGEVCWECVGDICERSSRSKAVYIACLKEMFGFGHGLEKTCG
jgi:hypothetical protein